MPASPNANTESGNQAAAVASRIISLDVMRGVIMVLMAIDHVRVYSGLPSGGPSPGIFFTRWVTHFCAPGFVFLAGTAAFLHGRKLADKKTLARYLVTRGLFLVLLELTLIRFCWTFNFDYAHWILAGVIWMLGWCMVLMAAVIWLPTWAITTLGIVVIVFQPVFGLVGRVLPQSVAWLWEYIYPAGYVGPLHITILYVIVPWIGVMALGYAFGAIMIRESDRRRKCCLRIGLIATAIFLIIGTLFVVLSSTPPNSPPWWVRLLNQEKYPPSVLFLLMTLGPMIALLPFFERAQSRFGGVMATFGRVPLFYYLLHIPLIHVVSFAVWYLRTGSIHSEFFHTAPFVRVPPPLRWGLPLLYLVFIIVVTLLYFACRWYAGVKARSRAGRLSYL